MREGAREVPSSLMAKAARGLGGWGSHFSSLTSAEPIKRKSALGDRLLSLGIAPLRESHESPTAQLLRCPLWVTSGHSAAQSRCPLYPQKRTSVEGVRRSALCQKRTCGLLRLYVDLLL